MNYFALRAKGNFAGGSLAVMSVRVDPVETSRARSKSTSPGVARQLVTFSCFAKEKVTKKKATPVCRPFGVPCVARLVRRLRNSRYALRQSSPTSPDQPPLLGGAQGRKI